MILTLCLLLMLALSLLINYKNFTILLIYTKCSTTIFRFINSVSKNYSFFIYDYFYIYYLLTIIYLTLSFYAFLKWWLLPSLHLISLNKNNLQNYLLLKTLLFNLSCFSLDYKP